MKKWIYRSLTILFVTCSVTLPAAAEIDCELVYSNRDLEYNLRNKSEAAQCCRQMCGGVGGVDSSGSCCCDCGSNPEPPKETDGCDEEVMCCYDEPESYDKTPDCCELKGDKYEFVASYYDDDWGNSKKLKPESQCCVKDEPQNAEGKVTQTCCEGLMGSYRNGNLWVGTSGENGDESCCKQGYPYNYKGEMKKSCCEYYGTEIVFGKPDNSHEATNQIEHCYFHEDVILHQTECCARDSRKTCDNSKPGYKGELSFLCCEAAQGVVVALKDADIPGVRAGERIPKDVWKQIPPSYRFDENAWGCCVTFGYRGKGETACTNPNITSDFDDADIDCALVVSNAQPNYNLQHREAATKCCVDNCGGSGGLDGNGVCSCGG